MGGGLVFFDQLAGHAAVLGDIGTHSDTGGL